MSTATDMPPPSGRRPLTLIAVFSGAAVAAALFAQHRLGMEPCPWCILQRMLFVLIALLAAVGAVLPAQAARVGASCLIIVSAAAGSAAALYQHFVAALSSSCNLTLADRIITGLHLDSALPEVFEVRASCADAAVKVLGVPFEFWSLALFVLLALVAARGLRQTLAAPRTVRGG